MNAKIKISWDIEVNIDVKKDVTEETILGLMLKSSNLMNCFGDALSSLDFKKNINERTNPDFKVVSIQPKSAKKQIYIES